MKSYTNKNGEIVTKEYNQNQYNKTYYEKNKEKINNDKYICECCNKEVKSRNKFNHTKTRIHTLKQQLYTEINNKIN